MKGTVIIRARAEGGRLVVHRMSYAWALKGDLCEVEVVTRWQLSGPANEAPTSAASAAARKPASERPAASNRRAAPSRVDPEALIPAMPEAQPGATPEVAPVPSQGLVKARADEAVEASGGLLKVILPSLAALLVSLGGLLLLRSLRKRPQVLDPTTLDLRPASLICPVCKTRYDASARFCGRDGATLQPDPDRARDS